MPVHHSVLSWFGGVVALHGRQLVFGFVRFVVVESSNFHLGVAPVARVVVRLDRAPPLW